MNTKESAIDELFGFIKYKAAKRCIYYKDTDTYEFDAQTGMSFVIEDRKVSADIVVYMKLDKQEQPFTFFYVVQSNEVKQTEEMVKEFRIDVKNPYFEVFIFDYEKRVWHAVKGMNNGGYPDASFSYTLDEDFTYYFTDTTSGDLELVEIEKEKKVWDYDIRKYDLSNSNYVISHKNTIHKLISFLDSKSEMLKDLNGKKNISVSKIGLFANGQGPVFDVVTIIMANGNKDLIPYIIIEVDRTENQHDIERKIHKAINYYKPTDNDAPTSNKRLLEYYFYDLSINKWRSYGPNADPLRPSFSKLLGADLANALKINVTKL